ncbi:MAG: aminopeptidase P family N-terminal domain-containing protein, partial [Rhodobacteraceae bacterium]|nr:aminopeptidase P family N-terminal domain-containing protein [Paracoccaceae bacterium]
MTEPLVRVRRHLAGAGIEALLVPIADRFQSSPIAAHDQRVAWLTGYQGTAGLLAISCTRTAFLVGRRDRAEATEQLDPAQVRILPGTHVSLRDWLTEESGSNPVRSVGYDPELHTHAAISALKSTLAESGLDLRPVPGFIDGLWAEQPPRPIGRLIEQSECHAGESGMAKRQRVLAHLRNAGRDCLLVANPESLAWLLNLRSDAVPYNPIPHVIGLLDTTGDVSLFTDCPEHPYTDPGHHGVRVIGISELESTLRSLVGNVQYDGSR